MIFDGGHYDLAAHIGSVMDKEVLMSILPYFRLVDGLAPSLKPSFKSIQTDEFIQGPHLRRKFCGPHLHLDRYPKTINLPLITANTMKQRKVSIYVCWSLFEILARAELVQT